MKKYAIRVAAVLAVCSCMMFSSCIGSFKLTNKLLTWNNSIGNKFVNELVFFAFWILPVYEVSGLADILVLNSIEFWSGNNPVAKGTKVIEGQDGKYLVKCDGKGYDIISENDGTKVRLDFDVKTQEWSTYNADGERVVFLTFIDADHAKVPLPNGDYKVVEISQSGCYAYQAALAGSDLAAR